MKIYIGETNSFCTSTTRTNSLNINIPCNELCIGSYNTQKVDGYILDYCTKTPIKGAKIILRNKFFSEQTSSDSNGYYKLYIPFETKLYNIKIYKLGYLQYINNISLSDRIQFFLLLRCKNYI